MDDLGGKPTIFRKHPNCFQYDFQPLKLADKSTLVKAVFGDHGVVSRNVTNLCGSQRHARRLAVFLNATYVNHDVNHMKLTFWNTKNIYEFMSESSHSTFQFEMFFLIFWVQVIYMYSFISFISCMELLSWDTWKETYEKPDSPVVILLPSPEASCLASLGSGSIASGLRLGEGSVGESPGSRPRKPKR